MVIRIKCHCAAIDFSECVCSSVLKYLIKDAIRKALTKRTNRILDQYFNYDNLYKVNEVFQRINKQEKEFWGEQ